MSNVDKRCCGSGVCIINEAGECWCGQRWDGTKMSFVPLNSTSTTEASRDGKAAAPNQTNNKASPKT
jgi:hypothetical protein